MLMVIFGAGASYDSSPDFRPPQPQAAQQNWSAPPLTDQRERWRPTLANRLFLDPYGAFGEIVKRYERLRPILPRLQQPQGGRSVEEQLEFFQSETKGDAERTRQLFSVRYYLHDLFLEVSHQWLRITNHVTNYVVLLDQIRHLNTAGESVCLVTFNYDLLLDDALLSFGYMKSESVARLADAHPMFKLFKPHGSADWARLLVNSRTLTPRLPPRQLIQLADKIQLSDTYLVANATDPPEIFSFEAPIVPAIAIPVQTKTQDTFEWPPFHRDLLLKLLPSVTKILIIGWQAKEAHFLKLLKENLPTGGLTQITHLQVVGRDPTEAKDISKQFTADIGRNAKKFHPGPTQGGFSYFVEQELVDFLFSE